jgi:hypothetical protein
MGQVTIYLDAETESKMLIDLHHITGVSIPDVHSAVNRSPAGA